MAILICGGAGYIGSHTNKLLADNGYETIIFDNLIYGHEEAVKWGIFRKGDLKNSDEIEELFQDYKIDAVLHFAAYAYVGESVKEPEKYYINNVSNTLNLLKTMRKHGCKKIIFSSTCATYGKPVNMPITENMKQMPINPYGTSKYMIERILDDYHRAYDLEYVVLRYFNAAGADFGGEVGESHDPETHVIPLLLDAASGKKDEFKIFGTDYQTPDGSCIRDYIHVVDLARAHLAALKYLEQGRKSDCFNLGNEVGISIFELIETTRKVTGKNFKVIYADKRVGDPAVLVASSAKAKATFNWKPKYSDIETIIKSAWQWHENKAY
ncbi:UDP-glucose 4-epimerase GalE [Zhenpiania hominis]|uniref:UDP-glucose 4-epimerase n=1 Tax=Zhenpiania hominis TaxID=2763644 RepID=A0A923NN10_9FIRM|nr:UDP-glucose 4-epimerase GalE [Zhenpiania hominis]MBC6679565.1 UDP-glucose 4-epimerase GalE [Zhenpiania hominis]